MNGNFLIEIDCLRNIPAYKQMKTNCNLLKTVSK